MYRKISVQKKTTVSLIAIWHIVIGLGLHFHSLNSVLVSEKVFSSAKTVIVVNSTDCDACQICRTIFIPSQNKEHGFELNYSTEVVEFVVKPFNNVFLSLTTGRSPPLRYL